MRSIASVFAKSPFGPLQQHMGTANQCTHLLRPMFDALLAGDQPKVEAIAREISDLESEADRIKNDLRNHLPKTTLLPVDRRDLLEILDLQDSMADRAQDVSRLLFLRPMQMPESLRDEFNRLLDKVLGTCDTAARIIQQLDELVETGFGGPEAERVYEMIQDLDVEETVTDDIGLALARKLYALEGHIGDVDILLWSRLFDEVSRIANLAEQMGNRLRLTLAK
jgi:predicted phosphate transport protein (TIGR00153 family)